MRRHDRHLCRYFALEDRLGENGRELVLAYYESEYVMNAVDDLARLLFSFILAYSGSTIQIPSMPSNLYGFGKLHLCRRIGFAVASHVHRDIREVQSLAVCTSVRCTALLGSFYCLGLQDGRRADELISGLSEVPLEDSQIKAIAAKSVSCVKNCKNFPKSR